jgi:FkbM family methyltransferase
MPNLKAYVREIAWCLANGRSLGDKAKLTAATLLFHASNAGAGGRSSEARRYGLTLGGQDRDLWLRTLGGDVFVLHEVFGTNCYDLRSHIADARTIVDLGANIGVTSLYFASIYPSARFVCVEPLPSNLALLARNVGPLGATVVEAAVSDSCGTVTFDDTRPAWGGGLSDMGNITVESISVDEILRRHLPGRDVDILKMDIEGGEQRVFTGPMEWLDRVKCIVAELHHPFEYGMFRSILEDRGFTVHPGGANGFAMPTAIRR